MSYTEEELKNFDWNAAVNTHLHMACAALNDLCVRPSGSKTMSVGPLQCYVGLRCDIIPLCHKCGKAPRARHDEKSVIFGCECGDLKDNVVVGDTCSAQHLFSMWAKMQMFSCALKNNVLDMQPCITALAANGYKREYDGMAKNGPKSLDELLEQKPDDGEPLTKSQKLIVEVCDAVKSLLLEKNRKYGDSALNPCRIFAKSDSEEQIKVRIDDKLNRIRNEQGDEDEDVVQDLIGYLVLLRCARKMKQEASR